MTASEADKIIEKYLGYKHVSLRDGNTCFIRFSNSLDSLIPVWEKLGTDCLRFTKFDYDSAGWFLDINERLCQRDDDIDQLGYSIQKAAAIATAKAIQQINND